MLPVIDALTSPTWPLRSATIEMMSSATSRNDIDRFGMFPFRASPRQADVLIVAGTLTTKMAGPLVRLWEQMPEPKWVIAMGACASTGGMYRSYAVLQGIDQLLPVDVYISGCPPRPEALLCGILLAMVAVPGALAYKNLPQIRASAMESTFASSGPSSR